MNTRPSWPQPTLDSPLSLHPHTYLGGLGVVQVPELDVTVPRCNEVGAVVREGDGCDFTGDFVGGNHHIFLEEEEQ